ncbi:MAG: flagellar export chaperone FlgN [Bdellovibrionales bacterium]|nr:flagellar export chaperone FlgN [Bdellovibrionales bacterium]
MSNSTPESTAALELMRHSEALCRTLQTCLHDERRALIEFRMEDMLQNNIRKQSLLSELLNTRKQLEAQLQKNFGSQNLQAVADQLEGPEKESWLEALSSWQYEWEATRERCKLNQRFIQHSLKNLNLFAENFRRLLGVHSVYSKQGREVDIQTEGSVLKAEY